MVWGDAGYQGVGKRAENLGLEVDWQVAMRPGKRRKLEIGSTEALVEAVSAPVRLVHTPAAVGFALTRLVDLLLRDVVLTCDEVDGLMAGLLTSGAAPTGATRLSDWLTGNADALGRR